MATLMFIDYVLRDPVTNAPIPQGMKLFRMLKEHDRVLLLATHKEKDDRWLRENKVNLVDDIIGPDLVFAGEFPEWRQVEFCRGQGAVELVVTANPDLAKKLLEVGITSFLFLHPRYLTEKFRPDSGGVKAWKSIVTEIQTQQEQFTEDHRVN